MERNIAFFCVICLCAFAVLSNTSPCLSQIFNSRSPCEKKIDDLKKEFDSEEMGLKIMRSILEAREVLEQFDNIINDDSESAPGQSLRETIGQYVPELSPQELEDEVSKFASRTKEYKKLADEMIENPVVGIQNPELHKFQALIKVIQKSLYKDNTEVKRDLIADTHYEEEKEKFESGLPSSVAFVLSGRVVLYLNKNRYLVTLPNDQVATKIHEWTHIASGTSDLPLDCKVTDISRRRLQEILPSANNEFVLDIIASGIAKSLQDKRIYERKDLKEAGYFCDITNVAFFYENLVTETMEKLKERDIELPATDYPTKKKNENCLKIVNDRIEKLEKMAEKGSLCKCCQMLKDHYQENLDTKKLENGYWGKGVTNGGKPLKDGPMYKFIFHERAEWIAKTKCDHEKRGMSYDEVVDEIDRQREPGYNEADKEQDEYNKKYGLSFD